MLNANTGVGWSGVYLYTLKASFKSNHRNNRCDPKTIFTTHIIIWSWRTLRGGFQSPWLLPRYPLASVIIKPAIGLP